MKATTLSTSFFSQLVQKRIFAAHIAELAATMAAQAGEAVARPLSQAQLERALQANHAETGMVMDLVLAWAGELKSAGKVADDDVYFAD